MTVKLYWELADEPAEEGKPPVCHPGRNLMLEVRG